MPGLSSLALAVGLFVFSHLTLAAPVVRTPVVARIGEVAYRSAYSLLAVVLIIWICRAYDRAPVIDLWDPPTALRHLSLSLMPFVCILLVAGVSSPSPLAMGSGASHIAARGPMGITKVTRHPVMWAIGLWSILHLLANGDVAALILFGGMTVVALGGAAAQDRRKCQQLGSAWDRYASQTSYLPFLAIIQKRTRLSIREIGYGRIVGGVVLYVVLLATHLWLFGVNPMAVG